MISLPLISVCIQDGLFMSSVDVWQTLEKVKGVEVLKEACAACAESIAAKKGRMVVKEEARVVRAIYIHCCLLGAFHNFSQGSYCRSKSATKHLLTGYCLSSSCRHTICSFPLAELVCCIFQVSDRDDKLLTEQLLDLERANQEVAGDDDSEEEQVGMGDVDIEGA